MRIEMVHPMMVHFTVGLLVTGVLLALVGDWRRWPRMLTAGQFALWVGACFGILAVTTGLIADDRLVEDKAIGDLVDIHETLAFITLSVFAAVAAGWLMLELKGWTWLRRWLHGLGVIGVGFILTTAYFGGEIVYNHGGAVYRNGQPVVPVESKDKSDSRSDAGSGDWWAGSGSPSA